VLYERRKSATPEVTPLGAPVYTVTNLFPYCLLCEPMQNFSPQLLFTKHSAHSAIMHPIVVHGSVATF
jgi:hypothetical protein